MIALGVCLQILALVFGAIACTLWSMARKQDRWDVVDGLVVDSSVGAWAGTYGPAVRYEYRHKGREFVGEIVQSYYITTSSYRTAERAASRYPKGKAVKVFVNPRNPYSAVLEPGAHKPFLPLMLFVAAVPSAIGVWLMGS